MNTALFRPVLAALLGVLVSASVAVAEEAPAEQSKLTLEDVIFDSKYVGQFLGPKTLLQFQGEAAPILEALSASGLAAKTTFIQLPAQAKPAKPKYETPPYLSESRKWQDMDAHASFLIFVSAEGKVESLYCYDQNDRLYALAVAQAITKWRFNAAKFGDTALPVLYQHTAKFRSIMNPNLHQSKDLNNNIGSPANTPMPPPPPS